MGNPQRQKNPPKRSSSNDDKTKYKCSLQKPFQKCHKMNHKNETLIRFPQDETLIRFLLQKYAKMKNQKRQVLSSTLKSKVMKTHKIKPQNKRPFKNFGLLHFCAISKRESVTRENVLIMNLGAPLYSSPRRQNGSPS